MKTALMKPNGDCVVGGELSGALLGWGVPLNTGSYDFKEGSVPKLGAFLTVFGEKGTLRWGRVIGTGTHLHGMSMDDEGHIYVTGDMDSGRVRKGDGLGAGLEFRLPQVPAQMPIMWLAKLDSKGHAQWYKTHGSNDSGQSVGVALTHRGVVMASFARDPFYVDGQRQKMSSGGEPDGFISFYSFAGEHQRTDTVGGVGKDYLDALVMNQSGDFGVIAGKFQGTAEINGKRVGGPNVRTSNAFVWLMTP